MPSSDPVQSHRQAPNPYLYRRVIFGVLEQDHLKKIRDMTPREVIVFAPLVILTLWMGIYPPTFLDFMHVSVTNLLDQVEAARATSVMLGQ